MFLLPSEKGDGVPKIGIISLPLLLEDAWTVPAVVVPVGLLVSLLSQLKEWESEISTNIIDSGSFAVLKTSLKLKS